MKFSMIGAAFALALAPMAASAVTLDFVAGADQNTVAGNSGPGFTFAQLHNANSLGGAWSNGDPTVTPPPGSVSKGFLSPFSYNNLTDVRTFFSVGGSATNGGSGSPNTLTFGSTKGKISILWGSIDDYNVLTVHTTTGDEVFGGATAHGLTGIAGVGSPSHEVVAEFNILADQGQRITGLTFSSEKRDGVTDWAAFEFALAPIPLPATGLLFGTALLAGGLLSRRKKSA